MKKIFTCFFFLFLSFFIILPASAINIIERADWWANEDYNYRETSYREEIFKKRAEKKKIPATEVQKASYAKQKRIDSYIAENFSRDIEIASTQYKSGEYTLAWPIKKTNYIKSIVVHHTHTEYSDSLSGIQNIHRYHSLSNQWWDIWYNYIIGYDWEIYEWRSGWDYTIAAHAKNNNFSTVWVALMGDFEHNEVPDAQYKALSELVKHLSTKYGINLSKRFPIHKPCISSDESCQWDIKTTYHYPLVWHLDAGHTNCPGEHLYEVLEDIRLEHLSFTKDFTPISYKESLESTEEKYWKILGILRNAESKKLIRLLAYINRRLKGNTDIVHVSKLKRIRSLILQVLRERG